jgi:hypothetical protein
MILVFTSPALKRWGGEFRRYAADTGTLYAANRHAANHYATNRYAANLFAANLSAANHYATTMQRPSNDYATTMQ